MSRPAATRARISAATSRSRSGCAATRSVSSVTSSAPWPRLTSASNRSSIAVRRSPSSRVTAASNAALSCSPTSCMAAPRHKREGLAQQPNPLGTLVLRGPGRRGVRTARRRRRRGPPSTGSRPSAPRSHPPAAPSAAGKPSVAGHSPRRRAGAHPRSSRRASPSGPRGPVRARGRSTARATGRPARRRRRRRPCEPRTVQASRSALADSSTAATTARTPRWCARTAVARLLLQAELVIQAPRPGCLTYCGWGALDPLDVSQDPGIGVINGGWDAETA